MPFELLTKTEATLTTFTGRVETHGKAKVSAVSFRLLFSGPNTLLDKLSQTARKTFYMAAEGQEDLPGVEPTTPHLRSRDIELGGCKIDGFDCELHDDPGNVDIELRVGTHHLTPDEAGYLWSKQQHKVFVMLAAPLTTQTNPDVGQVDERQLTLDGATGNPVDEASPARAAAEAAFSGEPERGSDWPFPRGFETPGPDDADSVDSEGGETDATSAVLADIEKNGPGHTATPISYQDPDKPSRTWTGKGKVPPWLKQALATGKTLADFQVKAH